MRKNKFQRIKSWAQKVGSELPIEKIILFGSYAYGKPNLDSDVDLLIIMESKKRPAQRVMDIWDAIYPAPFPLDILAKTPKEISERLKLGDFFIEEITQKGKVLYERPS